MLPLVIQIFQLNPLWFVIVTDFSPIMLYIMSQYYGVHPVITRFILLKLLFISIN
jgi:hypothetical protein